MIPIKTISFDFDGVLSTLVLGRTWEKTRAKKRAVPIFTPAVRGLKHGLAALTEGFRKPLPGAEEALRELRASGLTLFLLTSRTGERISRRRTLARTPTAGRMSSTGSSTTKKARTPTRSRRGSSERSRSTSTSTTIPRPSPASRGNSRTSSSSAWITTGGKARRPATSSPCARGTRSPPFSRSIGERQAGVDLRFPATGAEFRDPPAPPDRLDVGEELDRQPRHFPSEPGEKADAGVAE